MGTRKTSCMSIFGYPSKGNRLELTSVIYDTHWKSGQPIIFPDLDTNRICTLSEKVDEQQINLLSNVTLTSFS